MMVLAAALGALRAASSALARGSLREWLPFTECPLHHLSPEGYEELAGCVWARSSSDSEFHAGNVTVHLTKPITLEGGFEEENGVETFVGAEHGETLAKVAQPGPSLTEVVEPELLSLSERAHFEKDVAGGRTKVTATVELAGPASEITLSESNLLNEEGTALGLPVQVKLSNPFLGKSCYVGSYANPIDIELTSGTTEPPPPNEPIKGHAGNTESNEEGDIITIFDDSLVNNSYAAPGATGCGEGGAADAALNAKLGLPSPAGYNDSIIDGTLKQAGAGAVRRHIE